MDINIATTAFGALSQATRLKVFRLLIEFGPSGVPAGKLSDELGIPHNTLSFHLSHLGHAGLVSSQREGRSIIYSANVNTVESLIDYLKTNCCHRMQGPKKLRACSEPNKKKGKKS